MTIVAIGWKMDVMRINSWSKSSSDMVEDCRYGSEQKMIHLAASIEYMAQIFFLSVGGV
jgi:hypothetical protein